MFRRSSLISCFTFVLCFFTQAKAGNFTFDVFLDHPNPTEPDEYLWYTTWLPCQETTCYITGYDPLVSVNVAHHLIFQACSGVVEKHGKPDCVDKRPHFLYAWARGAPSLQLPPGVGFKFGKDSVVKAVRLGLHFKDLANKTGVDMSHIGARIHYTDEKLKKEAGVYFMSSSGVIEPNETLRMDIACEIKEPITLHIFAFRTHSHQLGKVMSGYVVHPHPDNKSEWDLIGKKDPLLPEYFYPAEDNIVAKQGDVLAARCTDFNFKNYTVSTGLTDDDEMCNYYFMFWTDDGKFPAKPSCDSDGPPEYTWEKDPLLNNIPDDADKL